VHTTIPISSRIPIKAFAELVRGFQAEGYMPRTKSDALSTAVEKLAALFNAKHRLDKIETVQEATDFLRAIGLPLETSERPMKAVIKATADEAMMLEGGYVDNRVTKLAIESKQADMYEVAASAMKRLGLTPPTREEYEAKKQASKASEDLQAHPVMMSEDRQLTTATNSR